MSRMNVIDQGFTSIANLMQEIDAVVDKMQEADGPASRIETFIFAQAKTIIIIAKAKTKQDARWIDPNQEVMDILPPGTTYTVKFSEEGGVL